MQQIRFFRHSPNPKFVCVEPFQNSPNMPNVEVECTFLYVQVSPEFRSLDFRSFGVAHFFYVSHVPEYRRLLPSIVYFGQKISVHYENYQKTSLIKKIIIVELDKKKRENCSLINEPID